MKNYLSGDSSFFFMPYSSFFILHLNHFLHFSLEVGCKDALAQIGTNFL